MSKAKPASRRSKGPARPVRGASQARGAQASKGRRTAEPASRPGRDATRSSAGRSPRFSTPHRPIQPERLPHDSDAQVRALETRVRALTEQLDEARRARAAAEARTVDLSAQARERVVRHVEADSAAPFADGPDSAFEPLEDEETDADYEEYDEEKDFLAPGGSLTQRRQELDRERADRELELGDEAFWLVCPKCGEHLSEHDFDNIKIDRCESCGGVWIDKGECDLLLVFSETDHALAYRTRGLMQ
jgi:hypothetical protein